LDESVGFAARLVIEEHLYLETTVQILGNHCSENIAPNEMIITRMPVNII